MVMMYKDCPSKIIVQMLPLQESNIHSIADKVLSMVGSQHGLPEYIMSDCDPGLCCYFWDEQVSLLDTILTFSMVSQPQTNEIAEVTSCTMEDLL